MELQPISEMVDLSSKAAIVTGAAMGIGFGIAYRLAEAGAAVVVADIDGSAAEAAAERLRANGSRVTATAVDVADADKVSRMVEFTLQAFGSVDILVNNAGIYPTIPLMQMDVTDFDRIIAINLRGAFLATKGVAKKMIERGAGGRIINITSIDAVHPSMIGLATYDASKHGLWGFTKNVALELAPHRIWVNAIAPGGVRTPGTGADGPRSEEFQEAMRPFIAKIPMGRMGEPDEIGKVALFLASDLSSYMTGAQIVVDGGVLLA